MILRTQITKSPSQTKINAMVTNHLRVLYSVYFTKKLYDSTAPVWRPADGRNDRTHIFLDIKLCPVKFRYYLKLHFTRMAFCEVIESKVISVPGWALANVMIYRCWPAPIQYVTQQKWLKIIR